MRLSGIPKCTWLALDASARQFERTGTIWELYHPRGESRKIWNER